MATLMHGNPPEAHTSFIGRDIETAAVLAVTATSRLVTLIGIGGTGKSRLALRVAADVVYDFPDGVWWVDLAPVSDPALVAQTFADVLGVAEDANRSVDEVMVDHLRRLRLLLVLDNCERLRSATADLVDALLAAAPGVKVLATSRVPLGAAGELAWPVPPLRAPATGSRLGQAEAVRLFADRCVAARPGVPWSDDDDAGAAEVCRMLDGLPLAVELAAACTRRVDLDAVRAGLAALLSGVPPTDEARIQAAIDLSYALLTESEQRLYRRLATFRGGWTADAVDALASDADGGTLSSASVDDLVRASLVGIGEATGDLRYGFHDAIRQDAIARLAASGERAALDRRHLDHYLELAEEGDRRRPGPDHGLWLARLSAEQDNIRAALDRAMVGGVPAEAALRLAGKLWWVWAERGHIREGVARLRTLLDGPAATAPAGARARAHYAVSTLERRLADLGAAEQDLQSALELARVTGDRQLAAWCLNDLSTIARRRDDLERAEDFLTESLAIKEDLGDRWDVAVSLNGLGLLAMQRGNLERGRALTEQCVSLCRETGNAKSLAIGLVNLGAMDLRLGNLSVGRGHLVESLGLFEAMAMSVGRAGAIEELGMADLLEGDGDTASARFIEAMRLRQEGDVLIDHACSLEYLARVATQARDPDRAARLAGAAAAWRDSAGMPLRGPDRDALDRDLALARAALGDAAFDAALTEGRSMSPEAAIAYALGSSGGDART